MCVCVCGGGGGGGGVVGVMHLFHKLHGGKANSVDPVQTASSGAVICVHMQFYQKSWCRKF